MSTSFGLTPALIEYLAAANPPEHPVLARCHEETGKLPAAIMQISAEQGAFMALLARLMNVKRAFEIGVFTGYSSTAVALQMKEAHGAEAHLLACDVSEDYTRHARRYWKDAGVDDVCKLEIAPAVETLDAALQAGQGGSYDFGFIDADKTSYDAYYERALQLLRAGGLLLLDNMLWNGAVADPSDKTDDTVALRALAQKIKSDPRVHAALVAVGDGVMMCVKK